MKVCAVEECGKTFIPKTHNNKYCSEECSKKAISAIVNKRYHAKKRIKNTVRHCSSCNAILSRYNESELCAPCKSRDNNAGLENVMMRLAQYEY